MGGRCRALPAVGACGVCKEEEDGGRVWITCLDRRGQAAWRRVAGEEATLQTRSEGFNLERKAETGEMWILERGRGGEVDISAEAENLESLQPKNWRAKCHQTQSLIQNCVRYVDITDDSDSLTRV